MSDTPIFDELAIVLPDEHAIHSLDPAAVLDVPDMDELTDELLSIG